MTDRQARRLRKAELALLWTEAVELAPPGLRVDLTRTEFGRYYARTWTTSTLPADEWHRRRYWAASTKGDSPEEVLERLIAILRRRHARMAA